RFSMAQVSHDHHYVPEWYQKRFLIDGATELHRLALKPVRIQAPNGHSYYEKNYLRRPPSRLFCTKNLYMLRPPRNRCDRERVLRHGGPCWLPCDRLLRKVRWSNKRYTGGLPRHLALHGRATLQDPSWPGLAKRAVEQSPPDGPASPDA